MQGLPVQKGQLVYRIVQRSPSHWCTRHQCHSSCNSHEPRRTPKLCSLVQGSDIPSRVKDEVSSGPGKGKNPELLNGTRCRGKGRNAVLLSYSKMKVFFPYYSYKVLFKNRVFFLLLFSNLC